MVVWVSAGGGESEVRGLIPFLEKHFACQFERKTPIRKRSKPRPVQGESHQKQDSIASHGKTGDGLVQQIKSQLKRSLMGGDKCDLIMILDDLDCHDIGERHKMFEDAINSVPGTNEIDRLITFAAPEIEAWVIADWDNSIAKHVDFRGKHEAMRHWLSHEKNVSFAQPESFSEYDSYKDACKDKLSKAIIDAAASYGEPGDNRYSKGSHTPLLLRDIDPEVVSQKCPIFRNFYTRLKSFCSSSGS